MVTLCSGLILWRSRHKLAYLRAYSWAREAQFRWDFTAQREIKWCSKILIQPNSPSSPSYWDHLTLVTSPMLFNLSLIPRPGLGMRPTQQVCEASYPDQRGAWGWWRGHRENFQFPGRESATLSSPPLGTDVRPLQWGRGGGGGGVNMTEYTVHGVITWGHVTTYEWCWLVCHEQQLHSSGSVLCSGHFWSVE